MQTLRNMTINSRIFWLLLICLMLSSTLIFQTSRISAQKIIEDFMYNYVKLNQENVESSLEFIINQVNMLSVRLLIHNDIYNVLDDPGLSYGEKKDRLAAILDNMMIDRNLVGDIVILTKDETAYNYETRTAMDRPDRSYISRIEQSKTPVWGNTKKDEDGNAYILLGRRFQNFYTGQNLGYLVIYIKERAIHDVLKNMIVPDRGFSFLMNDDAYILSYPDPQAVGSTVFDADVFRTENGTNFKQTVYNGKPSVIAAYALQGGFRNLGLDWNVISVISDEKLLEKVNQIQNYAIVIQLAAICLAILISLYVSAGIIKPVRRLNLRINQFTGANGFVAPYRKKKDELAVLESSFNEMVIRIQELIERNNEEKDRQREKELIALQAQINPHFLYNTLDAIGWLAKIHKQNEIEQMVIALSNFYWLSLHKGDKYITVEEEIGIVKSYVVIETLRFPGKFEVEYAIDPDILPFKMLKTIIQPLVENAVKHGISRKRGKGRIIVKGYRDGNDLKFEITDDGAGFDVRTLNQEDHEPHYKGGGYGIRNVNERIQLEYGAGYGVEIRSQPGFGTTSIVKVRIREEPETAAGAPFGLIG